MSKPLSMYQLPARKLSSLRYSHRERKCHGISSCCFVCLLLLCCWCWCDCCAVVAVMLLVCCCWSCVELFCLLCTVEVWCCFCLFLSYTGRSSPITKHGGERYCEVGRCVVETISMPLLQLPLTKRMAASVTCEVGRCLFESNSMPLLQIALAVTGVGKSIVMAASNTARLDVGSRYQFHAIVADSARCYGSRQVDCYSSQPSLEILEMIDPCDIEQANNSGFQQWTSDGRKRRSTSKSTPVPPTTTAAQ